MGARPPASQRFRRIGGVKCEFCSRFLPNTASLLAHQRAIHATSVKTSDKRRLTRSRSAPQKVVKKPLKIIKKKQLQPPKVRPRTVTVKPPISPKDKAEMASVESQSEAVDKMKSCVGKGSRKIEFQCPICKKMFPVYFSALRHIQKSHSDPENPKQPEPVRVEMCLHCNVDINNTEYHLCSSHSVTDMGLELTSYVCMGCEQSFTCMKVFDTHVSGLHSDGVESMFFPTNDEFTTWLDEMMKQTKCPYTIMGKYSSKDIYRCSYSMNDEDTATAHLCPSTVVYQEFPKGIQVHFYKEHSGHDFKEYDLTAKYKKYSITDLLHQAMKQSDILEAKSEETDMYLQFKKLMEAIVLEAAKININTLKILIDKAVDMTSILTNYDEDCDVTMIAMKNSNNVSDKQTNQLLTISLDALDNYRNKRSIEDKVDVPAKRLRGKPTVTFEKSPILQKSLSKQLKSTNKFSLADDKDSQKILKELGEITVKRTPKSVLKNKTENENTKQVVSGKKLDTPVVNTKTDLSVIKDITTSPAKEPDSSITKDSSDTAVKDDTPLLSKPKPNIESPSSFNDSYKDFVDKTLQVPLEVTPKPSILKRKTVVKTKIGQFKPTSPPKTVSKSKTPRKDITNGRNSRNSTGKSKDMDYEVIECENDLNILVLKI